MRRIATIAALGVAVATTACTDRAPSAPELRLAYDPAKAFDDVALAWAPPARGETSGYVLEMRLPPTGFDVVATFPLGVTQTTRSLAAIPESTVVEFRLRALPETDGARTGNVVTIQRGVRAPQLSVDSFEPGTSFHVRLSNRSAVADRLVLERQVLSCTGTVAWTPLPVALGATDYFDDRTEWVDGASYAYRLAAWSGAVSSLEVVAATAVAPFRALSNAALTPDGTGLRISFVNESACRVFVPGVRRDVNGSTRVALTGTYVAAGASGSILDPAPASGTHVYDAWSQRDPQFAAGSSERAVLPAAWPIGTWSAQFLEALPRTPQLARMRDGRFAVAVDALDGTFELRSATSPPACCRAAGRSRARRSWSIPPGRSTPPPSRRSRPSASSSMRGTTAPRGRARSSRRRRSSTATSSSPQAPTGRSCSRGTGTGASAGRREPAGSHGARPAVHGRWTR